MGYSKNIKLYVTLAYTWYIPIQIYHVLLKRLYKYTLNDNNVTPVLKVWKTGILVNCME